jgi:virginiamycin A acetyltransferase
MKRALQNQFDNDWLRQHFAKKYNISVGLYSYGCFDPLRVPVNTKIGRYCSFSSTCYFLNGNHGLSFLSLHPYLYNPTFNLVSRETINRTTFTIEDDVWVGHNAIILPSVTKIGRGAVIAAGAVVTKNVSPYEIVGGVPAKLIGMRFNPETIQKIEDSKWWFWSKEELAFEINRDPNFIYTPAKHSRAF